MSRHFQGDETHDLASERSSELDLDPIAPSSYLEAASLRPTISEIRVRKQPCHFTTVLGSGIQTGMKAEKKPLPGALSISEEKSISKSDLLDRYLFP